MLKTLERARLTPSPFDDGYTFDSHCPSVNGTQAGDGAICKQEKYEGKAVIYRADDLHRGVDFDGHDMASHPEWMINNVITCMFIVQNLHSYYRGCNEIGKITRKKYGKATYHSTRVYQSNCRELRHQYCYKW